MLKQTTRYAVLIAIVFEITACSNCGTTGTVGCTGDTGGTPAATNYTIGGTISGLTGTGLVMLNNGGDNLAVTANGSANFTTQLATGSTYSVTVLTQPTGQACTVTNGSGTVNGANVANISVSCGTPTPIIVATFTAGGLTWTALSSTTYTWEQANNYCTTSSFNGQSGGRMPSQPELAAFGNAGGSYGENWSNWPAVASFITQPSHWSVTTSSSGASSTQIQADTTLLYVSCVVGSSASTPVTTYSAGGLTWTTLSTTTYTWDQANNYCTTSSFSGLSGWMLPSQPELQIPSGAGVLRGEQWSNLSYVGSSQPSHWSVTQSSSGASSTQIQADTTPLYVSCVQ